MPDDPLPQIGQLHARAAAEAAAFLDRELRFGAAGPAIARLSGRPAAEHLGRTVAEMLPALAPALEPLLRQALDDGLTPPAIEVAGPCPSAPEQRHRLLLSLHPVRSRSGLVVGLDMTVRAPEEQASGAEVEADRGLLELLIQAAPVGVALVDRELRFLRVNERLAAVNRRTVAEHLGRTAHELFPELAQGWEALMRQVLASGEPVLNQELSAQVDGEQYSALASYYPVRAGDGPVLGVGILVEETTEQRRLYELAQESLRRQEETLALLQGLLHSAPVGISFFDSELRYLMLSRQLAELNGRPPELHTGRTVGAMAPYAVELVEPTMREVLATGETRTIELAHGDAADPGARRHWLLTFYPLRQPDGTISGVGGVRMEVTGIKGAEAALRAAAAERERLLAAEQAARAQAEAAVRVRDNFLSVAAHELKTPLATLVGQAQLAARRAAAEGASEAVRRSLGAVGEQALRLSRMIDDLLDLSRLEQGQLNLVQAPLDLAELARRVAAEQAAASGSVTVSFSAEGGPLLVSGDAGRLEQVVRNLVSNGVKYSHSGGAVAVSVGRAGGRARLVIADSGIGIPAEALPRLFEPFFRATNAEARRIAGIGIGLSIVHEIVARHGGSVEVTSELGRGATFTVSLPLLGDGVQ